MKEILNSFEYLPRLSKFVKLCDDKAEDSIHDLYRAMCKIIDYTAFITQPLSSSQDIILTDEIMSFCRANKDCTIEDAINANVKLKLRDGELKKSKGT